MFLVSLYLGTVQSLSALEIGLRIVFVPGVAAVLNPLAGRLMSRIRPIHVLSLGLVVGALGVLAIGMIDETTGYLDLIWRLALFGVSNALMLPAVAAVAVNSAPPPLAGMAGATNTALRQMGGAMGPAILGAIYAVTLQSGQPAALGLLQAMVVTAVLLLLGALASILAATLSRRGNRSR